MVFYSECLAKQGHYCQLTLRFNLRRIKLFRGAFIAVLKLKLGRMFDCQMTFWKPRSTHCTEISIKIANLTLLVKFPSVALSRWRSIRDENWTLRLRKMTKLRMRLLETWYTSAKGGEGNFGLTILNLRSRGRIICKSYRFWRDGWWTCQWNLPQN